MSASQAAATVQVADDDDPPPVTPEIAVTADSAGVTEGQTAGFTVTAAPAPTSSLSVTVDIVQTGDFAAGTGARTVTIPAGASTVAMSVATVDDSADEADGSVTVSVGAGSGYTVGSASSASVNVSDDDDPPPPVEAGSLDCSNSGLTVDEVTVAEPSAPFAFADFVVTLCGDNWGSTMIDYHVEHVTTSKSDFVYVPQGTLVFAPFQTTATVSVMINRDSITEGDETFVLVLENVYSYRHIDLGTGRVLGTITDTN